MTLRLNITGGNKNAPRKTQNAARRENFNHEQEGQLVVGGKRVHHGNR